MNNIFNLIALFAFVLCFTSCDDDEKTDIPTLPVTPANLNGTWQLAEWNGQSLAEGTYCYITFNRKEQTFEISQKFDSMYAREYDFGNGEWNNDYIVTDLLEAGSMIWTAKDDAGDVSKYVRCDEVPSKIVEEARADTDN